MGKLDGAPEGFLWFYGCEGEYGCLSNHYPAPITVGGLTYPTTEHFFQSLKFLGSPKDMVDLRTAPSPKHASNMGKDRARPMRPDWDAARLDVMREALRAKFTQHADLREALLSTGRLTLVEHTEYDHYWGDAGQKDPPWSLGAATNEGQNQLGLMLMELRSELREAASPPKPGPGRGWAAAPELRQYAREKKLLKIVDRLIDEVLREMPEDPIAHLAGFLAQVRPPAEGGGVTFEDAVLATELKQLWKRHGGDPKTFGAALQKACPVEARGVFSNRLKVVHKEKDEPAQPPAAASGESKFVEGGLVTTEAHDTTEEALEAGKLVKYAPDGYRPTEDALQLAQRMGTWHVAGKKLWPQATFENRIERNTTFMELTHNYGEPPEVVIPLYLYTIHVFRPVTWAYWVRHGQYGRWCALPLSDHLEWEQRFQQNLHQPRPDDDDDDRPEAISVGERVGHVLRQEGIYQRDLEDREREEAERGGVPRPQSPLNPGGSPRGSFRVPQGSANPFTAVFHDGKKLTAAGAPRPECPTWGGLTMYAQEEAGCVLTQVCVARYEVTEDRLRSARQVSGEEGNDSAVHPLGDTVAWLPVPECIAGLDVKLDDGEAPYQELPRPKGLAAPPLTVPALDDLPPPGLIEYLASRRPQEQLELLCPKLLKSVEALGEDADVAKLIEECLQEHNQQQFKPALYGKLKQLLLAASQRDGEGDGEGARVGLAALAPLIAAKLGGRPWTDDFITPSPLTIVHALQIQEVRWGQGKAEQVYYAALSGPDEQWITKLDPPGKFGQYQPYPLFRVAEEYEDQPFWYLNASMRNLQNKKPEACAWVPEGNFPDAEGKGGANAVKFTARPARTLGAGLKLLSCVSESPTLLNCLSQMERYSVHTSLAGPEEGGKWRTLKYHGVALPGRRQEESFFDAVACKQVGWYMEGGGQGRDGFLKHTHRMGMDIGYWMMDQLRPLLYYIDTAMKTMRSYIPSLKMWCKLSANSKTYRGLQARLSAEVYQKGNVFVWAALSSTSTDMSISQTYAKSGGDACVFIMKGFSSRLIAPWSRFGREEEWLYPLNSGFQVTSTLTESFQQMLGTKSGFQLYEADEVDEVSKDITLVRRCLGRAQSVEEANIAFVACAAIKEQTGVLDLALKSVDDGKIPEKWMMTKSVLNDPTNSCPVAPATGVAAPKYPPHAEEFARSLIDHPQWCDALRAGASVHIAHETARGRAVVEKVAQMLGLRGTDQPDFLEVSVARNSRLVSAINVLVRKPSKMWDVELLLRWEAGRRGFACRDDGADTIRRILRTGVRLTRIDVRNNGITAAGARKILAGLRRNPHCVQLTILELDDPSGGALAAGEYDRENAASQTFAQAIQNDFKAVGCAMYLAAAVACASVHSAERNSSVTRDAEAPQPELRMPTTARERNVLMSSAFLNKEKRISEKRDQQLRQLQRVITLRCAYNARKVPIGLLESFGAHWPHDAAEAFHDVPEVPLAFLDVCEANPHRAEEFFYRLAECVVFCRPHVAPGVPTKYPALPKAFHAAVVCNLSSKTLALLLDMGCKRTEIDEHGETPLLKLRRHLAYAASGEKKRRHAVDRDNEDPLKTEYAGLLEALHVPLKALPVQGTTLTQRCENAAYELVRMAEEQGGTLAEDVFTILTRAVGGAKSDAEKRADIQQQVSDALEKQVDRAKDCPHLGRVPVSRTCTTLFLYTVFVSTGITLAEWLYDGEVPEYKAPTGRKKVPRLVKFLKARMEGGARELKALGVDLGVLGVGKVADDHPMGEGTFRQWFKQAYKCMAKEDMKSEALVRKTDGRGLAMFEHEFMTAYDQTFEAEWARAPETSARDGRRIVSDTSGTEIKYLREELREVFMKEAEKDWKALDDMDEPPQDSGRKIFTGPLAPESVSGKPLTQEELGQCLWEEARCEDAQPRKMAADGRYHFKHNWAEGDAAWDAALSESGFPQVRDEFDAALRNFMTPTESGGYDGWYDSRRLLRLHSKMWLCLNGMLMLEEEDVQLVMYRTLRDPTDTLVARHLSLTKGEEYAIPEVSLWCDERRVPNPNPKQIPRESLTPVGLAAEKAGEMEKALTRAEFQDYFRKGGDVAWERSDRKYTGGANGWEPQYKNEFTAAKEAGGDADQQWSAAERVMHDPVAAKGPVDGKEEAWSIVLVIRGRIRCARIAAMEVNKFAAEGRAHDFLLPALSMFNVENVSVSGHVVTVSLISRGSVFETNIGLKRHIRTLANVYVRAAEPQLSDAKILSDTKKNRAFNSYIAPQPQRKLDSVLWKLVNVHADCEKKFTSHMYFGVSARQMPVAARDELVTEYMELVKSSPAFDKDYRVGSGGNYCSWKACGDKPGQALPLAYRPAVCFLDQLCRGTAPPGDGDLPTIPHVEVSARDELEARDSNAIIEIDAGRIRLSHANRKEEKNAGPFDPVFEKHVEGGELPLPSPEAVFGPGRFKISVGHCLRFLRSLRVSTSERMPDKFFESLTKRLTWKREYRVFWAALEGVPLLDIASQWEGTFRKYTIEGRKKLEETEKEIKAIEESKENKLETLTRLYMEAECAKVSLKYLESENKRVNSTEANGVVSQLKEWVEEVKSEPSNFGFRSASHASLYLKMSLSDIGGEVCISQRGVLFTETEKDHLAQIVDSKETTRPLTFLLSPCRVNFLNKPASLREQQKYFEKYKKGSPWCAFKDGREIALLHRIRDMYRCVFQAAKENGVRHMAMVPSGTGLYLGKKMVDEELKHRCKELYFKAQFELLCEQDWGFECYWLTIGADEELALAHALLDRGLVPAGVYNNPTTGMQLRCNIVLHQKDAKGLAGMLAKAGKSASYFCPVSTQSVMLGCVGQDWETARSWNYATEQDLVATSTCVLASFCLNATDDNDNDLCAGVSRGIGRRDRRGSALSTPTASTPKSMPSAAPSEFLTVPHQR